MALQPELLQSCLQQAAQAAGPALERCLDDAIAGLQVGESQGSDADRAACHTAWSALLAHRQAWCAAYPPRLLAAFDAALAEAADLLAAPAQAPAASPLLRQVAAAAQHSLAELDPLICSVQDLPAVWPERNPLRPQVWVHALQGLLSDAGPEAATEALWLAGLAGPLGRELQLVYERLANGLTLARVKGTPRRLPPVARSLAPAAAAGQDTLARTRAAPLAGGYLSDEPVRQPPPAAREPGGGLQEALLHDFLRKGGHIATRSLTPAYYATIEEELAALKAVPDSAQAPLDALADSPLTAAAPAPPAQAWGAYGRPRARAIVRSELRKEATQLEQALGLEVVRQLVGQVAQDPRLLGPVREALRALEPALLRLALVDPQFFSDESHPGRRLMERVAQRSFRYHDEQSAGFSEFFLPVARALNTLNTDAMDDSQPFADALASLSHDWEAQDLLDARQREQALQPLRFAEARQTLADTLAQSMRRRPDLAGAPALAVNFVLGVWTLVMAHARLDSRAPPLDAPSLDAVVDDLLWSVQRETTLKQPARLIELLPGLLTRLHGGLGLLGKDDAESAHFFDGLMKLHQPVLKLRRAKHQQDVRDSGAAPLDSGAAALQSEAAALASDRAPLASDTTPLRPEPRPDAPPAQPWLAPDERDATGFDTAAADAAMQDVAPPGSDTAAPAATTPFSPGSLPALHQLVPGSWVDIHADPQWLRAQLVWTSEKGTLFMFISHGGQPHSMTRRSCERLLREGLLRPVDTQGVVGPALDALNANARQPVAPPARQAEELTTR